jgi:hypothetical protein
MVKTASDELNVSNDKPQDRCAASKAATLDVSATVSQQLKHLK